MTLAKLQQQLLRDLKRSPKKAAFLGVACLAAIYFWAPLIAGWISPPKPGAGAATGEVHAVAQAPAPVASAPAPTAAPATNKGPQYDWKQLAAAIDRDPRMHTAELDLTDSAAFGRKQLAATELAAANSEAAPKTESAIELTPQQAGLSLTGAMIGPRRRVAIINGHACLEGSQLTVGDNMTFVVAAVRAREVVLVRGDKEYVLPLVRRGGEGKKDGLTLMRVPE